MINVAVVGFGLSAKTFHIPFICALPEFKLVAISSSQKTAVETAYPNATYYSTAEEMISNVAADLVIITSPNDTHYPLAKLALQREKHVILEKPFVTQIAHGEMLIALAKSKGLVLSVYQNRRWDGDFLTVKNLLNTNQLGNLKLFESHFDRFRPNVSNKWRETSQDGGGLLFDLAPHLIDQTLQLFGLPEAITARCELMREGSENIDFFNLTLHYSNHLAILEASLFCASANKRFSVQGDLGTYEKFGLDPQEDRLKAGILPKTDDWADEVKEEYGTLYNADSASVIKTENGGYQHYFKDIASAINNKHAPAVTAEQAMWNIKLIELAIQSSRLRKTINVENNKYMT